MSNLSFQYPAWFIIFCLLAGLVYAFALYFRDKRFRDRSQRLNWVFGILRFLSVSLLSMLLLSPLLKSLINETKKPVLILAQDQSQSIAAEWSKADSTTYVEKMTTLRQKLSEKYDLVEYAFGEKVREGIDFQFKDKVSNISDVMTEVYDLYANQNLGAVVLATDGIFNEGSNPIYSGTKLNAPIFAIALGDTTPNKDLIVKRVFHNKIAYLSDKFSIQVDIDAQNCTGNNTILNISRVENDGKLTKLKQLPININQNSFFTTKEIILDANRAGVNRYRVSLNSVKGEENKSNNARDIFVDVLDARQKILILANAPHPDLSAIKSILSNNKNYQVTTAYIDRLRENIATYDFVILHQLPSTKKDISAVMTTIKNRKIPRLFIIGSQSNLAKASQVQSLVNIKGNTSSSNDVLALVDSNFKLFTLSDELKGKLPRFAPLTAPFGEFTASPSAQVLLYQKIGSVNTKYPLLTIGEEAGTKVGVLAAEGIWKWKMFDYLQHQNHDIMDELLSKTMTYLTLKEDKRKFRVSVNKNIFNENEAIYFDAELYNESYEAINDPDASLTITNSKGKEFPFTFNKSGKAYALNAGIFPEGNYRYKGTINSNGKQLVNEGRFSVRPIQLERFETTANHSILRVLSQQFGGEMLYANQLDSLPSMLEQKDSVKPVMFSTSSTRSIINLRWIFFLLLGLLSLEWFGRKYFGAY